MIDLTKEYSVKPRIVEGEPTGLGREGMSKMPGTSNSYSVSFNETTKRYKTGLDEFAPEVRMLPEPEASKKIEWIKKTREELEKMSGVNLSPTNSDFWDLWRVDIEVTPDKKVRVMGSHPQFVPHSNWEHALALITLDANDSLPRSREQAGDPKYKHSQFLLTTSEEEVSLSKNTIKKTRQRNVEMAKLFEDVGASYDRAFSIAYLLGVQKEPVGIEKLEEVLEIFTPQKEYIDRFLALCKLDDEELSLRITIKKAIDYDIIRYNGSDRIYYRGGANFRPTELETIDYFKTNLAEAAVAREFMEIKSLVEKRDAKRKKK